MAVQTGANLAARASEWRCLAPSWTLSAQFFDDGTESGLATWHRAELTRALDRVRAGVGAAGFRSRGTILATVPLEQKATMVGSSTWTPNTEAQGETVDSLTHSAGRRTTIKSLLGVVSTERAERASD